MRTIGTTSCCFAARDNLERLATVSHANDSGFSSSYHYNYDTLDRVTHQSGTGGSKDIAYDATSQVTDVTAPQNTPLEQFDYDPNGNRQNPGYATGPHNQLAQYDTADQSGQLRYDLEGNLVWRERQVGGVQELTCYEWDYRDRLTRVTVYDGMSPPDPGRSPRPSEPPDPACSGTARLDVQFSYDAFDRRLTKTIDPDGDGPLPAGVEYYIQDTAFTLDDAALTSALSDLVLVYYDPDGSGPEDPHLTNRYLYGPAVDEILADEQPPGVTTPTGTNPGCSSSGVSPTCTYWPLSDSLGSVRDLLDDKGIRVAHLDYSVFGVITRATDGTGQDATNKIDSIASHRFLYTGRELDLETGLQTNRARYYDAVIGRWISQDQIGFGGGDANLYRYVGNTPADATDPVGEFIVFPNKEAADTFLQDLKKSGAKHAEVVVGKDGAYVLVDPRDREAVFKYADKHFPEVHDEKLMAKERKKWEEAARRRTEFLIAAGIAGFDPNKWTDVRGSNAVLVSNQDRFGPVSDAGKHHTGEDQDSPPLHVDIGGEGKHEDAVNVNIQPRRTTTPPSGDPIPHLVVRVEPDDELPFGDKSVDRLTMEGTPISPATAKEIARVTKPGGTIDLVNPDLPSQHKSHQAVIDAVGKKGEVKQEVVDGVLHTTITVTK